MDLPIRGARQAAEGVTMKTRKILATTTLGLLLTACAVLAILPLTASAAPARAVVHSWSRKRSRARRVTGYRTDVGLGIATAGPRALVVGLVRSRVVSRRS